MHTFIYIVWFAIPLFFFGITLWAGLEQATAKKKQRENTGDFFRQGLFVLGCVLVAVMIDQYWLAQLVETTAPDWLPLLFFQVVLLPIVLYLGALIVGPSREIRIGYKSKNARKKARQQR